RREGFMVMRSSHFLPIFAWFYATLAGCAEHAPEAEQAQEQRANTAMSAPAPVDAAALPNFTSLVERFGQAVVNVEVVGFARLTSNGGASPSEDPLLDFCKRFGIPAPDGGAQGDLPLVRGAGSGFIVSE